MTPAVIRSQAIGNYIEDETDLYTSTKQVNQFFRRFNGEEDIKGERLYPEDKGYRDQILRSKYLENLFNKTHRYIKGRRRICQTSKSTTKLTSLLHEEK